MPYNFQLSYLPGHLNSADYLSRSNPVQSQDSASKMGEEYIHMITTNSLPISVSIKTLQSETANDE